MAENPVNISNSKSFLLLNSKVPQGSYRRACCEQSRKCNEWVGCDVECFAVNHSIPRLRGAAVNKDGLGEVLSRQGCFRESLPPSSEVLLNI